MWQKYWDKDYKARSINKKFFPPFFFSHFERKFYKKVVHSPNAFCNPERQGIKFPFGSQYIKLCYSFLYVNILNDFNFTSNVKLVSSIFRNNLMPKVEYYYMNFN